MTNRGVQEFYYTATLPSRSVAIAQVSTPPTTPASLTDINNTPYLSGDLSIRKLLTLDTSSPDFLAPDYNVPVTIYGATEYKIYNQFFEITNQLLADNITPAFYVHTLPSNIDQNVVIIDLQGNPINTTVDINADLILQTGNLIYHTLNGNPYRIRYVDSSGYLHTDLLQYNPVIVASIYSASSNTYTLSGRFLTVASTEKYYLRFTQANGYYVLPPYNAQPNTPWYPRIRFGLTPPAPEWALQNWLPQRPYLLAAWVPGTALDTSLIQFERQQLYYDALNLPDILVFNSDYSIKYALDGSAPGSPIKRGTLYNWQRGQIQYVDPYKGRIQIAVPIDSTDIIYGFYSYSEPDLIYTTLDINPYTNSNVKNMIVEFYFKSNGTNPFDYVYHQVIDPVNGPLSQSIGQWVTNDPDPSLGTNIPFAVVSVGVGIGIQNFTFTDIRTRGGGLIPSVQNIPQAVNFWDLGYWDGKPYPIGGTMAVYVPASILNTISSGNVEGKIQNSMPMGTLAVVHYYNPDGSEFVE
jgi:hypothetical protein